jgi:hypothetical protein
VTCDWLKKWIEFPYRDSVMRLQGILPPQMKELQEVSVEHVLKWDKGNDLWAAAMVQPIDKPTSLTDKYLLNGVPAQIKDLIHQFDTIFKALVVLSPSRAYGHSISLLPNVAPVNCRDLIVIHLIRKLR